MKVVICSSQVIMDAPRQGMFYALGWTQLKDGHILMMAYIQRWTQGTDGHLTNDVYILYA